MAEYSSIATQAVRAGANVLFTETLIPCNRGYVRHREGSGIFTLKGICTNGCRARYKVYFNGNISLPTGGTAGTISLAIAIAGEPVLATLMQATPAAVEEPFNVSAATFIDAPAGCCQTISVQNTSGVPIDVRNANIIFERVA